MNHSVVCWTDQGLLQMDPHIVTTGTGVFEMTLCLYLRHFFKLHSEERWLCEAAIPFFRRVTEHS